MQTWGSITGIYHALLLVLVLPVFLSCIAGKLQREVADHAGNLVTGKNEVVLSGQRKGSDVVGHIQWPCYGASC